MKYKFGGYIVEPVGKFNGHLLLLVNNELVAPSHSELEPCWTPEDTDDMSPKNRQEGTQDDFWDAFIYEQGSGIGLSPYGPVGLKILTNPRIQ